MDFVEGEEEDEDGEDEQDTGGVEICVIVVEGVG